MGRGWVNDDRPHHARSQILIDDVSDVEVLPSHYYFHQVGTATGTADLLEGGWLDFAGSQT